jgi:hypothetical protein
VPKINKETPTITAHLSRRTQFIAFCLGQVFRVFCLFRSIFSAFSALTFLVSSGVIWRGFQKKGSHPRPEPAEFLVTLAFP